MNELYRYISDPMFLDQLYRYAYQRCNTAAEAEDLSADIVLEIWSAMQKQAQITHIHAFVWTIARRVYADFCEKRRKNAACVSIESLALTAVKDNEIDAFHETIEDTEQVQRIFREISFLSKAYRDVMILYYIEGKTVREIANLLQISETAVKQRLFAARNIVRNEVQKMEKRNLAYQAIQFERHGTGNPGGNDPTIKTERAFSRSLITLCKEKPQTAKELAEQLCVPMPFVEEELEIQCRGENGEYGMLRKMDKNKYGINVLLADTEEMRQAAQIYETHLKAYCANLKQALEKKKEEILSFPYLSAKPSLELVMWVMLSRTVWDFQDRVGHAIAKQYFADITPSKRNFTVAVIAYENSCSEETYGCNGIDGYSLAGYRWVFVSNLSGKRLDRHFACGHNLAHDPLLQMTLRAIGGLHTDTLSEEEKEIAARAVACGYLQKNDGILEPKIVIIRKEDQQDFYNLSIALNDGMDDLADQIAAALAAFMKQHIPPHLMGEYPYYNQLIAGSTLLTQVIEACLKAGLLREPKQKIGAEGVLMVVDK